MPETTETPIEPIVPIVPEDSTKALPIDNPEAVQATQQSQARLKTRRNALVKELFRVGAQIHPPPSRVPSTPRLIKTPATTLETKEITEWDKGQDKVKAVQPTQKAPDLEESKLDEAEQERKMHSINGVHLDLYDYFSIEVHSNNLESLRRLQFINSWVATEGRTFNEGMRKLHSIDVKLGSSDTGDTKLIKLYNWIRFSRGRGVRK